MSHPLFIVDVFAEEKYAGNQLAVILHDGELATEAMQRIARETNFSETTFVRRARRADGAWDVRIFTPVAEVPFAGHPTLGTAWVLRHCVASERPAAVNLQLAVGPTPVRFVDDDRGDLGWFAAPYPAFGRVFAPEPFADLLGLAPGDIAAEFPVVEVALGVSFTFVPIATVAALSRARFRSDRYETLQHMDFPACLFLFCRDVDGVDHDMRARMFATPFGIMEDPATGSANAFLAAYLLRYEERKRPALALSVAQGVEMGRPSLLRLAAERHGDEARIEVGGRVLLSVRGELV